MTDEIDGRRDNSSDEVEEARLDAEALVAYRASRVIPHAKVAAWLDSWGTDHELPCPKPEPGTDQVERMK
jgi:predicted transcriptional regulator